MPEILSPHPPKLPSSEGVVGTGRAIRLAQLLSPAAKATTQHQDPPPAAASAVAERLAQQLDSARLETFGRYYEQMEGRLQQLRQTVEGGLALSRRAMLDRVDELSAALHRDMTTFRQEQQREMEDLKRDIFTAVMSLSAINDRVSASETQIHQRLDALQQTLATFVQNSRLPAASS
jgi:phosphoglycerate-specific signal transduction histidine kinase